MWKKARLLSQQVILQKHMAKTTSDHANRGDMYYTTCRVRGNKMMGGAQTVVYSERALWMQKHRAMEITTTAIWREREDKYDDACNTLDSKQVTYETLVLL